MGFVSENIPIILLTVKRAIMNARSNPLFVEGLLDFVSAGTQPIEIQQQGVKMAGVARVRLFRRRKEYWQIGEC